MSPFRASARLSGERVEVTVSVPLTGGIQPATAPPAAPLPEGDRPSHSKGFSSVNWRGTVYSFSPKQRAIVAALWNARGECCPWVAQDALLDLADSDSNRMRDLFKGHPAWGVMIVSAALHGGPTGSYQLAPDDGG